MKLAILEQKLLKEEHERQLVQEKADQVSPQTLHLLGQLFEVTMTGSIHSSTLFFSLTPTCTHFTINAEIMFFFTFTSYQVFSSGL